MMVDCSIIIPTYNKANLTRQCLDRLLALPAHGYSLEIIVVDDGSTDQTQRVLAAYEEKVRLLKHDRNQAFATACNNGAAIASGEYLVFLNNDTLPFSGWLESLVSYLKSNPRVGLASSKLLYPNGTIQHAGMAVCLDRQPRLIYVGFPSDHPCVNKPRRMQLVSGACNILPRSVFERSGGFDPAFVNGYEDLDLCMRLGTLGFEVHYCPDSVLFHLESVSDGRFQSETRNSRLFRDRWADILRPDDFLIYLEDGLIQVAYHATRFEIAISPQLGATRPVNSEFGEIASLLSARADQVYTLIRENSALRAASIGGEQLSGGAAGRLKAVA